MTASNCRQSADREGGGPGHPFTMAFQPIFDVELGEIFAHEALLRTPAGGPAADVLGKVAPEHRYTFDQTCRVKAIELAAAYGMREALSINLTPNALHDPDGCIARTVWAADRFDFPAERIVFEFTEAERIADTDHLGRVIERYRACGFRTAVDDFGAGYSGLGLLAELQPDIIKIDIKLVRGLGSDPVRQNILNNIKNLADRLGIVVVAEGVETADELGCLMEIGIALVQGFLLARPQLGGLVPAEVVRAAAAAPRLVC
jgi:EAL domain-containing protein (putative c-di-GMP-specific phosphodiesterase class I)